MTCKLVTNEKFVLKERLTFNLSVDAVDFVVVSKITSIAPRNKKFILFTVDSDNQFSIRINHLLTFDAKAGGTYYADVSSMESKANEIITIEVKGNVKLWEIVFCGKCLNCNECEERKENTEEFYENFKQIDSEHEKSPLFKINEDYMAERLDEIDFVDIKD